MASIGKTPAAEERMPLRDVEVGFAPFTTPVFDLTPVVLRDLFMSEAKAEDGNVEIVDRLGIPGILSARREAGAARDDDAPVTVESLDGVLRLADLRANPPAPNLGGDQVSVLTTEVNYGHGVVLQGGSRQGLRCDAPKSVFQLVPLEGPSDVFRKKHADPH